MSHDNMVIQSVMVIFVTIAGRGLDLTGPKANLRWLRTVID